MSTHNSCANNKNDEAMPEMNQSDLDAVVGALVLMEWLSRTTALANLHRNPVPIFYAEMSSDSDRCN